jgi:hypothetical protein
MFVLTANAVSIYKLSITSILFVSLFGVILQDLSDIGAFMFL